MHKLNRKEQNQVLKVFKKFGELADYQLTEILSWHPSKTSRVRNDLLSINRVLKYGKRENPFTKRSVNTYIRNEIEIPYPEVKDQR